MDQSVIHHPLEGLTQAARERNRSIVGRIRRILPRFWNWNHRSLPLRWGNVPGGPNVIEEFKKSMQAGSRKVPQELIVHTIRTCGTVFLVVRRRKRVLRFNFKMAVLKQF
ncbi:hypothetical protein PoB_005437800 [Plakobranchus ocellatus]|uniref:Uncharacterized protein n=1 Tax=Plakobranchus ocellatus TaxID=259542 RepID=A0AAV4C8N3_9GAST|nr:hypothetical protein PoB_005437800 [Plakobranchus ocellatus]